MCILNDSQAPFPSGKVDLSASLTTKLSDIFNDDFLIDDCLMDDFSASLPTKFSDICNDDFLMADGLMDDFSASLPTKFSDICNDDFLIADGLMDDFTDLFDIDAIVGETSSTIDDSMAVACSSNIRKDEEKKEEVHKEEKVRKVREDRSRSPAPKRRRYDTAPNPHTPPSQKSIEDLQERCKLALQQLALSMRRSEMTRSEIASFQKTCGTRAKLQGALLAHNPEAPFLWTVYGMKKP
jgi:hypothetical protein